MISMFTLYKPMKNKICMTIIAKSWPMMTYMNVWMSSNKGKGVAKMDLAKWVNLVFKKH
jgi:hypothetical protein